MLEIFRHWGGDPTWKDTPELFDAGVTAFRAAAVVDMLGVAGVITSDPETLVCCTCKCNVLVSQVAALAAVAAVAAAEVAGLSMSSTLSSSSCLEIVVADSFTPSAAAILILFVAMVSECGLMVSAL